MARTLVEDLRNWTAYTGSPMGGKAADEIEKLRAALRDVLEMSAPWVGGDDADRLNEKQRQVNGHAAAILGLKP